MKNTKNVKIFKWGVGAVILGSIVILIIARPLPFLFYPDLPWVNFFGRGLYIFILASLLSLYRIWRGPTSADRIVAIDILGIMIVGLCSILTISTGRSWYIDIGIAWALQSFISTLALSKYLEGKDFGE
jgi:multicomponent Na+:H+ antiporter subunit F